MATTFLFKNFLNPKRSSITTKEVTPYAQLNYSQLTFFVGVFIVPLIMLSITDANASLYLFFGIFNTTNVTYLIT